MEKGENCFHEKMYGFWTLLNDTEILGMERFLEIFNPLTIAKVGLVSYLMEDGSNLIVL